jgi:DNA polymerase I
MKFRFLTTLNEVIEHCKALQQKPYVVLDTETTGLNPHTDKLVSIVMSGRDDVDAVMFAPEHLRALAFLGPKPTLVLHNFKFDFHFITKQGGLDGAFILANQRVRDTMLLHHLHDENKSHRLDDIIQELWKDKYKEEFWAKFKTYQEAPLEEQLNYACRDVVYTGRLYELLCSLLVSDGIPASLVEHAHALAFSLYETEHAGLKIDMDYLSVIGADLKAKIAAQRLAIRASAPAACQALEFDLYADELAKRKTAKGQANVEFPEINFDSSKQLMELLYKKLRLPEQVSFKTKKVTTDDGALTAIANKHPIVPLLQDYRANQKVYTAFVEGTLEKQFNGRIYPSFNVNGTVTGRISSSNPNMQQLPRDGGVRGMYVPDGGHKLVTCDYSQLEICLAAHFSNDPVLIELITSGKSMHDHTAKECGIDRQAAKMVNFLVIYGGQEFTLSQRLGITLQEAGRIMKKLWITYKGLKGAIDECHAKVQSGDPIVSPFGRRRRFPKGLEGRELGRAQRQAFNALVQGTGADLTHTAFHRVARAMRGQGLGTALFPVHDELVIMPKTDKCKEAAELLQTTMVRAGLDIKLRVPLRVDCSEPLERWEK